MSKTYLYAIAGLVFSTSLSFAQPGGGTGGSLMGGTAGGATGSMSGGGTGSGSSAPDRSMDPDGSVGGNSRTGRLNGNGSDDESATDPNSTLPRDRSMDDRSQSSMGSGSGDSDSEPNSSARSMGR
jgi:hypothetical protein